MSPAARFDTRETTDGDRGRTKVRRHSVCHDVDWLAAIIASPSPAFPA